jgi:epoxyqueuosine reductase
MEMISKSDVIAAAYQHGFDDVGFTTADPFSDHRQLLFERREAYAWTEKSGLDLFNGTDPATILPTAKTIIVLIAAYFKKSFPHPMESHFGRCYLDDDRVTRDGLTQHIKAFRVFLQHNGIASKVPFNLPHRVAAARAGLGTFGKNCLFYSNKVARRGSWMLPIAVVVDAVFEPDLPTLAIGCPDWCRNACIAACPTKALQGNCRIDPSRCISYLTYYGEGITPLELREPMGMYVYGCDRCQNVCPRNLPWLSQELPMNEKVAAKKAYFELPRLLHMDRAYFEKHIWPHMFYMPSKEIWRWKMNVTRVMGNSRDSAYIADLVKAFEENTDERVRAMAAWAIGKIGGHQGCAALNALKDDFSALVKEEIARARHLCF